MPNRKVSIEKAREFYTNADSAHDFEHILRVTRMAEQLAAAEGGDPEVVRAAALLHDIARHAEDEQGKAAPGGAPDHAEVSAQEARAFLMEQGADAELADRVAEAIRSHRFRGSIQPTTLEGKILFDADKLDSIGAIGVARAYAVCGMLNQKLYSEPESSAVATRSQHNAEHTPVDEYHVKLKHLRQRFYTPTAQRIAAERDEFMRSFFEQLTREVRGEG
jgi:uncharacterized protein